jgi:hypothetical protein
MATTLRHAAGIFHSLEDASAWAARHRLTGIVTEYPLGDGCFDVAVRERRLSPSKLHHGTPANVAAFSPGWTRHVHIVDGVAHGQQ